MEIRGKVFVWGFFCFTSLSLGFCGGDVFALDIWAQKVIPGANRGPTLVFEPALVDVEG